MHTGKGNVLNDKRLQWEIVAIPTEAWIKTGIDNSLKERESKIA